MSDSHCNVRPRPADLIETTGKYAAGVFLTLFHSGTLLSEPEPVAYRHVNSHIRAVLAIGHRGRSRMMRKHLAVFYCTQSVPIGFLAGLEVGSAVNMATELALLGGLISIAVSVALVRLTPDSGLT